MNLSKANPIFSDLRDLGQAFDVPVVGLNQRQISEALYFKVLQIVASSSVSATVSGLYEYNVKTYGAVGNGIADDTSAIQATITAALATGSADVRPIIRIPPGDYRITSGLDFRSDTVAPHLKADGATISWEPTSSTANQVAVKFGALSANTTVTRGRVEGLWVQSGTTFATSGAATTNANWSPSGHTAIEIHNCGSWEFEHIGARDMKKGIVLSSSAPSSTYVGCAYNTLLISRLINCKYSISADLLSSVKAFSNQHKIIGGNFAYSTEGMVFNEMVGNFVTSSAVLTGAVDASGSVIPYTYRDCNDLDPKLPRLPWDHVSNFVVVGGLGNWAQILTAGVDYTITTGVYGATTTGNVEVISTEAKAIVDRNPLVLGLGSNKLIIYVTMSHVSGNTVYEDVTGKLNFTQDARELMVWQGVDKDKVLLRYGSGPLVANDYLVDVANRRIILTTPNTSQLPIVVTDRPRHVTIYADRGMSTPDMWNFDGSSFEGTAEYIDAAYVENANNVLFTGCRFECEHTRKMGFYLGKASADCHLINGSQTDLDDYHGNKEYRDFGGGTSSSTRLYREVWEGKYLTLDGLVGFRKKNYLNSAVAIEPLSGDAFNSLLSVGSTDSWNVMAGISSMASSGYAFSAQTKTGTPYYGLLFNDESYNSAPVLLRLTARTTAIPELDGKMGGAIQMDGPVAYTYASSSGSNLAVDSSNNLKVTSATYSFQASDIGYQVCISSSAPWTPGNYVIASVVTGSATLTTSPAPIGTTNGEFVIRSCITSPLLRIYSRWMASGYDERVSLTQFYVGDYNNLWRTPLSFMASGHDVAVTLGDRVGIRATSTEYAGLNVPWVTGDTQPTAHFGSMASGNTLTAIVAESCSGTPITTNTNSRYSMRNVVTELTSGLIATPLVLAHKSTLDPGVSFGVGIEFRADTTPTLSYSSPASALLVVDSLDNTKVTSAAYSFAASDVGKYLTISSGVGWTPAKYAISSVVSGAAFLNSSPAPISTSGGVWSVGTYIENLQATIASRWLNSTYSSLSSRLVLSPQCVSGSVDAVYIDALADLTGQISLRYTTGIRSSPDLTRALGLYVPWVTGDSASIPIASFGGISSGASNISLLSQTYSGTGLKGTANTGSGVIAESLSGYPLTARIASGPNNSVTPAAWFTHTCTGTATSGIGVSIVMGAATNGATERIAGGITADWGDIVDATRRGRMSLWSNRTASAITTAYEGVRVEALATGAAGLGFFGATAVAKPTVTGDATDSGVVNLFSSLANLGLITNSSTTKGQVLPYVGKSGDYNVTVADSVIAVSASATMTLPSASSCLGSVFTIKNLSTSTVTVSASDTIDGSGTYPLTTQYSAVTVQSNGSVYYVLGSH